jgi:hypothetical protein
MTKKGWMTPALIATACTAMLGVLTITGKAQDTLGRVVVENRKPFFHDDHKSLCDTIDSLKRIMCLKDSSDRITKDRVDLTLYIVKEMASSDQKQRAMNKLNEDKQLGIVR